LNHIVERQTPSESQAAGTSAGGSRTGLG
jgi:hypothetical protein